MVYARAEGAKGSDEADMESLYLSGSAGSALATSTTWWEWVWVKASVRARPAGGSLGLARARLDGQVSCLLARAAERSRHVCR